MSLRGRTRLSDERGATLVTAVIALPVLVLMLSFVIDVGNWFVHKRHLQMQADAAVLAGAGEVQVPCDDNAVLGRARQYGGLAAYNGQAARNLQLGGTAPSDVHGVFNSPTWHGQSSPTDSDVATGGPCATRMIDLKLTETDLPFFFGIGDVDFINVQARAEIRALEEFDNFIPLSVSEARWKNGEVTYFDQSGGGNVELGRRTISEAGANGAGQSIWDHGGSPFPVTFSSSVSRVGVRVALSTSDSVTCGDTGVQCFDNVLFARGYAADPAVSAGGLPVARQTGVSGVSCNDGSFTTTATGQGSSCSISLTATVDWGVANPSQTYNASVIATIAGADYNLTWANGTNPSQWSGSLSVPPDAGALPITLRWEARRGRIGNQNCTNQNRCTGSFGTVQRTFSSSSDDSGPIELAQLWENGSFGVTAFPQCSAGVPACTRSFVTKIALPGTLEAAQSVGDPLYRMRPLEGNSQTHLLDCDEDVANAEDELALGCHNPGYVINSGQSCGGYNNPQALPDPSPCAITQTGQSASQIGKGINKRILGDEKPNTCTAPNRWAQFFTPGFDTTDPRIVHIVLTDWSTFTGSGNEAFPVRRFAAFYITGWQGNPGFDNPCQGNGDDTAARGEVVGHWIKYVQKVNTGGAGNELCDLSGTSLELCVPVLTR